MKSQSAMEYLMTYGWAILIIAIVLVAFFSLGLFNPYTFKPKASPGSCQVVRPNGPWTGSFVSLVGTCLNEIPQSVAQFNGHGDYIKISNTVLATTSFSISAYINLNQICTTGSYYCVILDKQPPGSSTVRLDTGIKGASYYFTTYNSTTNTPDSGSLALSFTPTPNTWYLVTMTTSPSTGKTTYINGVRVYHNSFVSDFPNSSYTLVIGCRSNYPCGGSEYFNGSISNVQIYNTSLTANEVTALYNEGIGGKPIDVQHIVGWWPLNGNAYDYSGNNNNGTTINVKFISNWETGYTAPT